MKYADFDFVRQHQEDADSSAGGAPALDPVLPLVLEPPLLPEPAALPEALTRAAFEAAVDPRHHREFGPAIPYPETSKFQGALIAPVWLDFIRRQQAKESA